MSGMAQRFTLQLGWGLACHELKIFNDGLKAMLEMGPSVENALRWLSACRDCSWRRIAGSRWTTAMARELDKVRKPWRPDMRRATCLLTYRSKNSSQRTWLDGFYLFKLQKRVGFLQRWTNRIAYSCTFSLSRDLFPPWAKTERDSLKVPKYQSKKHTWLKMDDNVYAFISFHTNIQNLTIYIYIYIYMLYCIYCSITRDF